MERQKKRKFTEYQVALRGTGLGAHVIPGVETICLDADDINRLTPLMISKTLHILHTLQVAWVAGVVGNSLRSCLTSMSDAGNDLSSNPSAYSPERGSQKPAKLVRGDQTGSEVSFFL
jgi:hypothetical protein